MNRKLVEILGDKFGYTTNSKGFKVLNHVRLIQGDGVNELTIRSILGAFMSLGWSADNIAFGMGGASLQQLDRDTQRFAMKCSAVGVRNTDGSLTWVPVQKDPITDPGKRSKAGRVTLFKCSTDGFYSADMDTYTDTSAALNDVFMDGDLLKDYAFSEVRTNSVQ